MSLVQLDYFPGWDSQQSGVSGQTASILVNPAHIVFVITAQGFEDGNQCWLRLASHHNDFLVKGSLFGLAAKFKQGT